MSMSSSTLQTDIDSYFKSNLDASGLFSSTNNYSWIDEFSYAISYCTAYTLIPHIQTRLIVYAVTHYHGAFGIEENNHAHAAGPTNFKNCDASILENDMTPLFRSKIDERSFIRTGTFAWVDKFVNPWCNAFATKMVYNIHNTMTVTGGGTHAHVYYANSTNAHNPGYFDFTVPVSTISSDINGLLRTNLLAQGFVFSLKSYLDDMIDILTSSVAEKVVNHIKTNAQILNSGNHVWGNSNNPHTHSAGKTQ